MRKFKMLILGLVLIASVITTAANGQEAVQPGGINPPDLIAGLNWAFWFTLVITVICGAIGGVVYELLILQGNIELPHKPVRAETPENPYAIVKNMIDLGIWARIIIGAAAAVAALLVLSPSTTFGLIATALVAGSAGTSIFRSMQDRFVAVVAQRDVVESRNVIDRQGRLVEEAQRALDALKEKILKATKSPEGESDLIFPAEARLKRQDVEKVEQLLSEARGVSETPVSTTESK
jgi:hypothetical protein